MTQEQKARRAQIEAAAFAVLERVGYKKASMLQIAREAKASNETLYAWYGNKQALFSSLITANAGLVETMLQEAAGREGDVLVVLGQQLLQFMATEKAIIINRAAVADVPETGLLAKAIEENARQVMLRFLDRVLDDLAAAGRYDFGGDVAAARETYVSLLVGEVQMQQALGAVPALDAEEIGRRAERARALFDRLYARDGAGAIA